MRVPVQTEFPVFYLQIALRVTFTWRSTLPRLSSGELEGGSLLCCHTTSADVLYVGSFGWEREEERGENREGEALCRTRLAVRRPSCFWAEKPRRFYLYYYQYYD